MTEIILPPSRRHGDPNNLKVFLAGAIDMGNAILWQDDIIRTFNEDGIPVTFFNPRRADWDASWTQTLDSPQFVEQVNWELDFIERADILFMFFPGNSIAPISLLEFGLGIGLGLDVIIAAEPGYHRRGNLEVMCVREGIVLHTSIDSASWALEQEIFKKVALF